MQAENPAVMESCLGRALRVCGKVQKPWSKRHNALIHECISERHETFI